MARIILAEDDDAMRQFLATALARAGHQVASFADGTSAMEALVRSLKSGRCDLLIADIVMPGLDGIALAREGRGADPNLKVLLITGFAAVVLAGNPEPVPGATVLSKPFHLRQLVQGVNRLLSEPAYVQ
jgi:two-component system cell cycle response regulator CpdR